MKPKILALGGIIIAGGILVAWAYRTTNYPIRNAPAAGQKIIAFGDSLVAGVGAEPGDDFVTRLARLIKRPIINAGMAGDTTADAIRRVEPILEQRPDLVIVLLGTNDIIQQVPAEQTVANLRRVIQAFQDRGAAVLLIGVRGGPLGNPFGRAYAKLARETHAAYLPNVLDSVLDNSVLIDNDYHPNRVGYSVIAERIAPGLEQLIKK